MKGGYFCFGEDFTACGEGEGAYSHQFGGPDETFYAIDNVFCESGFGVDVVLWPGSADCACCTGCSGVVREEICCRGT